MERTHALGRPALFTVTQDGQSWVGADQAWYPDEWQQKAGCGPTSAAMLVTYLAQAREEYRPLYPSGSWEKEDVMALMQELWAHITPGKRGVNTLHIFTKGLSAFAAEKGVSLPVRSLDVPRFRLARPTVDQCCAFLRSSLDADCPVAWLNLHSGGVRGLDDWHWVVITGLEEQSGGPILCTFLDGGAEHTADFRLWFQQTKLGGGLVSAGGGPL